jgi:anaerobic selenocysteine-containing dehydrogenase
LRTVRTMCARDCPDACFLDVEVQVNTVTKVRASSENPVTAGITCPRAHGDPQRVYSMKRVLNPYIRPSKASPGFKLSTWDEALDLTASKLKETIDTHGPGSVLLLDYSGNTGLITSIFSKRLWNALGATRTDYTVCSASGHAALRLHYGLSYGVEPEELLDRRVIVFWGFNARHSSPHMWAMAMKARRERGAIIVVVDPRRSESTDMADLWLYPRPGSDVALCYGVARSLITGGQVDQDFIRANTSGYEAYRDEALKWTPERVEQSTGVTWDGVKELADALAMNKPPVFMIGIGLQKSVAGAEAVRAVSLLPALLGQHRGFYYSNSRGRYLGGNMSGESLTAHKPRIVSQISLGERLARGEFKFVYVFSMNPVLTLPDSGRVSEGLKRGDVFLVVHETHITETCDLADVVLPAPTYLEKDDVVLCDSHPYVRKAFKAVEPEGLSRDEGVVMRELARRVGVEEPWVYADPWDEAENVLKDAFADGGFRDYMEGAQLRLRLRPRDQYQTPTGRIEFASSSAPEGVTALPRQIELYEVPSELILMSSSVPKCTHTQFRDVYGENPTEAWISSLDAERNGVRDGDAGTLVNDLGSLSVTFKVTDRVHPGVLWMSRELVDREGQPQNGLTPGTPQKIGGGPVFNSTRVRIL